jgi:hypothetical protein
MIHVRRQTQLADVPQSLNLRRPDQRADQPTHLTFLLPRDDIVHRIPERLGGHTLEQAHLAQPIEQTLTSCWLPYGIPVTNPLGSARRLFCRV